ncbi:phenylacetic acid degradation operon negative regulatory protein PaaX [Insolitispirillum peregrinum]|uniref:Transcriptional regulator, PaaX family n=1 Tax=Insolitispirillum peregrinum TaxID=80876 RepID=A0A1N7MZS6_9PROT|nr:phenylacetic acid degradation operon negative regulatory protein PaaX [Insolitispirillum peregrinum]SIS91592.1 transcriptional regulator, PaaX family [Insolitispirillum peregrinum]
MLGPIDQHLDAFRQQRSVQAGSLIISLFGDAVLPRGGTVWLGSLIRLLEPLGLNERLVRTAVFRLVKDGWLEATTQGRRSNYALSDSGRRRFEDASRLIYAAQAPEWDRRWRLIFLIGELTAKEREHIRRALFWQGFGALNDGCFIHPGADLAAAFDGLVADGLGPYLKNLMPLQAADARTGLSASNKDIAEQAWDLGDLSAAYERFAATYLPLLVALSGDASAGLRDEDAFLVRTLLIHDYRRLLLRDPELPEVLLPTDWPGQRVRLLCKDIYRRLLGPSERHLDQHLSLADGSVPVAGPTLLARFRDDDPLLSLHRAG